MFGTEWVIKEHGAYDVNRKASGLKPTIRAATTQSSCTPTTATVTGMGQRQKEKRERFSAEHVVAVLFVFFFERERERQRTALRGYSTWA